MSRRRNLFSKLHSGIPRNQISELHFYKFPGTAGFQCWKADFKTEVCSCSGCPTLAMLWTKEVEVAKSVDDFVTSQSIEGHEFPDSEMLDEDHHESVLQKKS